MYDKKAANRKWHQENREKNAARHKKWRAENPDKDAVYNKRWREKNREKNAVLVRNWHLLHNFGISAAEYGHILSKQNGVCVICLRPPGEKRRLAVDHCHEIKKVRGLLCLQCNRGLGLFRDDHEKLVRASMYIKETYERNN